MRRRVVSVFLAVIFCIAAGAMMGGCKEMRCEMSYRGCLAECGDGALCKAGCEINRGLCKM